MLKKRLKENVEQMKEKKKKHTIPRIKVKIK